TGGRAKAPRSQPQRSRVWSAPLRAALRPGHEPPAMWAELLCLPLSACHSSPASAQRADSAEVAAGETTSAAVRGNAMTQPARKEDPSREETPASIHRMTAEEDQETPPSAAAPPQPLGAMPAMQDDSPSEPVASPAPSSGAGPTERSSSDASAAGQG